ncbi:MAG: glutathione S-transferase family protein [Burkholderiales bacterium]
MGLILYGTPLSSFSCKVRLALAVKGCAVEERMPPGGYRSAEYRQFIPSGRVPGLIDGEFALGESDAIIEYIDETQAGPDLLPSSPQGRARSRALSRFHDFYLDPPIRNLFPELDPRLRSTERVSQRAGEIVERLDMLETMIDPSPYLAGSSLSLADCAYPPSLILIEIILPRLGYDVPLGPKLDRWWQAVRRERVFERALGPYRAVANAWAASKLASP